MSVKRNIAASFLGNSWSVLVQIAFVPLYIKYLGIEAYGLIGVYVTLQALLSVLDLGLTPTLIREMARYTAGAQPVDQVRKLLRTIELVSTGLSLAVLGLLVVAAPSLAADWLRVETLPVPMVVDAIDLIAVLVALRLVASLYRGVFTGLQRQVWLNGVGAAFATLRGGGVVLALIWLSPTIDVFFLYQVSVTLVELVVLRMGAWRLLRSPHPPSFSTEALRRIWRFSATLTLISVLALLLTQTDKILLSNVLTLRDFGYYSLASSVAGSLGLLIVPISNVAYPRLTELVVQGNQGALLQTYHRLSQTVAIAIGPSAVVLALFSDRILMLWINDAATVRAAAPLVTLLSIGFMLNGLVATPHNLQLAYGRMGFIVALYCLFLALYVPALYFGVLNYGPIAAGYAWIALNGAFIVFAVPRIHRKLLYRDRLRWHIQDVASPVAAAFSACYAVRFATSSMDGGAGSDFGAIALALLLSHAAAILVTPIGREMLARYRIARSDV